MKKFILLFLLFASTLFCNAQATYYFHFDSSLVATSYAGGDSIWFRVTNIKNISPMPYGFKHYLQIQMKFDSISGGFEDSARAVVQLRMIPFGSLTSSKYQSIPLDSVIINAGPGSTYWNPDTIENLGVNQYWILAYCYPGVLNSRIRFDGMYSSKPN
jgi:hypothetical protein